MATYNGHRSYNAWNVSLWINNDEGLYNTALAYARRYGRTVAAREILAYLHEGGVTHTPDGVKYTVTNIELAIRDM